MVPGARDRRRPAGLRQRVRLSARHRLGHGRVQLPDQHGVAAGTQLFLFRPGGHEVQLQWHPGGVAGRRVRAGPGRTPTGRLSDPLLPRHVQHQDVLGEHARAAVERQRSADVGRVQASGPSRGRYAGRLHGHGLVHRRVVLRAHHTGRDRVLESHASRPTFLSKHGRGGTGLGRTSVPVRPQSRRQLKLVGDQ